MIAEINVFSVSDEMSWVMGGGVTGCRPVLAVRRCIRECSRAMFGSRLRFTGIWHLLSFSIPVSHRSEWSLLVTRWMTLNILKLNADDIQMICIDTLQRLASSRDSG